MFTSFLNPRFLTVWCLEPEDLPCRSKDAYRFQVDIFLLETRR